ncbi:MAG: hypothetical protein ABL999_15965 [Pyrinomonadaceae bacterium]
MAELQLGKYEFYPYEFDKSKTLTLEELKDLLRMAKAVSEKDVKTPSRFLDRRRPRGKRRG